MNIAFSTLVIVVALIPGIIFLNSYFSGKFPRELTNLTPLSELALFFICALPIDALALTLFEGWSPAVRLDVVGRVLLEERGWLALLTKYLATVLGAFTLGVISRRIVWALRLDTRPLLRVLRRMKQDWYYLLQGRLHGLPRSVLAEADILMQHPEGSRLYSGIVNSFDVTRGGELRELVLLNASRGKGRGKDFGWHPIPGERFVLLGPQVHSINIRYRIIDPPQGRWRRYWSKVSGFLRALVFEEP